MSNWYLPNAVAAAGLFVACSTGAEAHSATDSSTSSGATTASAAAPELGAVPAGALRFVVAGTANTARYRVREQLMGHDLPNDAVGETQQVTGVITVDSTGAILRDQSKFIVTLTALQSDQQRRDGYVQRRLLETDRYPTVELVPTALRGLPSKLPAGNAGPLTFELLGNLTVRGVTKPTTWKVTARQSGDHITGTASTRFTFDEFGLTQPRVPVVLSVADTIGLEYDFSLTREGGR